MTNFEKFATGVMLLSLLTAAARDLRRRFKTSSIVKAKVD
jgi:hypothetical protein